jgi:hypothetical protein
MSNIEEITNYYLQKTESMYKDSEKRIKAFLENIEKLRDSQCKQLYDKLGEVSEELVYIDDYNRMVSEFVPKDKEQFKIISYSLEQCLLPYNLEIGKINNLRNNFKKLNNKVYEKCFGDCDNLDDPSSCMLNCVNNLRFNYKSYYNLLTIGIEDSQKYLNKNLL